MAATKWEAVYVFISSTFNDMHAERDYLVKNVFPDLRDWCERRKLRLVDIDLRWGVTDAAARSKNVVGVCLDRIDACRPFFLCFLGQRYGWVPTPDDVSTGTLEKFPNLKTALDEGRSVTDIEILHAVVEPLEKEVESGKIKYDKAEHAFFYLRDCRYLSDLPKDSLYLEEIYTNKSDDEKLTSRRDDALGNLIKEIEGQDLLTREYKGEWNKDQRNHALKMSLSCPSTEESGQERWRENWKRYASIELPGDSLSIPGDQEKSAESFNNEATVGRLGNFRCSKKPLEELFESLIAEATTGDGNEALTLGDIIPERLAACIADFDGTQKVADLSDGAVAEMKGRLKEDITLADTIVCDLQAAISKRHPDHNEVDYKGNDLQKDLDQQAQFVGVASEGFVKRTGDFNALNNYIHGNQKKVFLLTAAGGQGKTTLIAKWVDNLLGVAPKLKTEEEKGRVDEESRIDAYTLLTYRFIGQSDGANTVYSLLRSVLEEFKAVGRLTEDEELPTDPIKQLEQWPEFLKKVGAKGRTVIVFDALNQLDSGLSELDWIPRKLPESVKMVVSFKTDEEGRKQLQAMKEYVEHNEVDPFDEPEDRKKVIDEYLNQYLKELGEDQVKTLVDSKGSSNPLFLKIILSELRVFGDHNALSAELEKFGDEPVAAFEHVLERLEEDPMETGVELKQALASSLLFGLLAHARRGLSVEELTEIIRMEREWSDDKKPGIRDTVELLVRQMRPFLARRDGRHDYFYEAFGDAARKRYVTREDA